MIYLHSSPTGWTDKKRALLAAFMAGDLPDVKPTPAPIALSAAALEVVTRLAAALDAELQEPFRRAIAIELARYRPAEINPGLINRIGKTLQREFVRAPTGRARR